MMDTRSLHFNFFDFLIRKDKPLKIGNIIRFRVALAIILVEIVLQSITLLDKYFTNLGDPMLWEMLAKQSMRIILMVVAIVIFVVIFVERALYPIINLPIKRIVEANLLISSGEKNLGRQVELGSRAPEEIISIVNSREKMLAQLEQLQMEMACEKERMHEELVLCGEMQKQLLPPSVPEIKNARIEVLYKPFSYAGGDIYDFIEKNGNIGLFIGDVSGHGVASSLAASLMKIPFETRALQDMPPGKVLEETNSSIFPSLGKLGIYITSFYGVFDFGNKILSYSMAGHPPQLLVRKGQCIKLKADPAFPLGMFENATYGRAEIKLEPGDRFYFFTDGAYEVSNKENKVLGDNNFCLLCEKYYQLPPDEALKNILNKIATYSGGVRQDDICIITVDIA